MGRLSDRVLSVDWSPDGKRLATGSASANEAHMLRIWDAATGKEIRKLDGHSNSVRAVQWSPDGTRLASAEHGIGRRIINPQLIPIVYNQCARSCHFERSEAESRNLFLIGFSTSGHFVALRSK